MGVDPLNSNLTDLALNEKKNQNLLAMNNILQNESTDNLMQEP
jgi:hypothetical protein